VVHETESWKNKARDIKRKQSAEKRYLRTDEGCARLHSAENEDVWEDQHNIKQVKTDKTG
jgi:hypothetical protein